MGWGARTRKTEITIDHTLVPSGAALAAWPLLLSFVAGESALTNLPSEPLDADGAYPAKADGGDLMVASDENGVTRLSLEVVDWTPDNAPDSNASAELWVADPDGIWQPSSVADVSLWVAWGDASASQPAADAAYGSQAVWDAYYSLVSHDGGITDSTANGLDGTATGTYSVAGQIGAATNIAGTGETSAGGRIVFANNAALVPGTGEFTIEAWVQSADTYVSWGVVLTDYGDPTANFWDLAQEGGEWRATQRDGASNQAQAKGGTVDTDWHLLSASWDGSTISLYDNASLLDAATNASTGNVDTSGGVTPGTSYPTFPATYGFPGTIDELRVSKGIGRSDDWHATSYASQLQPGVFASPGTVSDIVSTPGPTIETIGPADCDYTTPQDWYDAHAGDITGNASAPFIGEIQAGTYASLEMTGSTTDATHYFHLRPRAGDEFRGVLDDADAETDSYPKIAGIYCADDYFRLGHLVANGDGYVTVAPEIHYGILVTGENCLIDAFCAQDIVVSGSASGAVMGARITGAGTVIRNSIAARLSHTSSAGGSQTVGFYLDYEGAAYNCAAHLLDSTGSAADTAAADGFIVQGPNAILRNSAVGTLAATGGGINTTASVLLQSDATDIDYNAVGEAVVGDAGANSQTSLVPSTEWVGAGTTSTDFHLAATAVKLPGYGGSLSGYDGAPATDIDGHATGLDIGPDSPETLTIDKWALPLWEPTLPLPPCPTGEQFLGADPSLWAPIETVTFDKWAQPLWGPTLPIPPRPTGEQFFEPEPALWPVPESVTVDKWYQPLADPEFPPPPTPQEFFSAPAFEQVVTPDPYIGDWYFPLEEPTWPLPSSLDAGPELLSNPALFLTRYYVDARGKYRVFNEACYRIFRSTTAPPVAGDTPWTTSATLPVTPADTFGDGTWWLAVSYFNGVLDSGFLPLGPRGETYVRLEIADGELTGDRPAGPQIWQLTRRAAGVVRIDAVLYAAGGEAEPDQWAIAYTIDGSDPPEDSPDVTVDAGSGTLRVLQSDLPAQAHGTTVKVRLQTRRNVGSDESPSWVYSADSTIKSLTAAVTGPTAPIHLAAWPGRIPGSF